MGTRRWRKCCAPAEDLPFEDDTLEKEMAGSMCSCMRCVEPTSQSSFAVRVFSDASTTRTTISVTNAPAEA